jgi:hypothetical protein
MFMLFPSYLLKVILCLRICEAILMIINEDRILININPEIDINEDGI